MLFRLTGMKMMWQNLLLKRQKAQHLRLPQPWKLWKLTMKSCSPNHHHLHLPKKFLNLLTSLHLWSKFHEGFSKKWYKVKAMSGFKCACHKRIHTYIFKESQLGISTHLQPDIWQSTSEGLWGNWETNARETGRDSRIQGFQRERGGLAWAGQNSTEQSKNRTTWNVRKNAGNWSSCKQHWSSAVKNWVHKQKQLLPLLHCFKTKNTNLTLLANFPGGCRRCTRICEQTSRSVQTEVPGSWAQTSGRDRSSGSSAARGTGTHLPQRQKKCQG